MCIFTLKLPISNYIYTFTHARKHTYLKMCAYLYAYRGQKEKSKNKKRGCRNISLSSRLPVTTMDTFHLFPWTRPALSHRALARATRSLCAAAFVMEDTLVSDTWRTLHAPPHELWTLSARPHARLRLFFDKCGAKS